MNNKDLLKSRIAKHKETLEQLSAGLDQRHAECRVLEADLNALKPVIIAAYRMKIQLQS